MQNTTTRRSLLKAAPATALIAAIPTIASAAVPADNVEWEKAKAAFRAAGNREQAAGLAHSAMEEEQSAFERTAPEREVTYTREGFRIAKNGVRIEAEPSGGMFVLNHRNYTWEAATAVLGNTPEYSEFAAEMAVWQSRRDALAAARGWAAIEQEWVDSIDARFEAWRVLVACPVTSAEHIAEKLEIARSVDLEGEDAALLLDGVSADLARVTGRA